VEDDHSGLHHRVNLLQELAKDNHYFAGIGDSALVEHS
jgi:hypothetical protein